MNRAHVRTHGFFQRKSANLPQRGFIALKHKRICVLQICGRLLKMWQIVADCGDSFWEKVHFSSSIIQLYTLSQATSLAKTLHGESAHTPRSIGSHSTEYRPTLHVVFGTAPKPLLNPPLKGTDRSMAVPPVPEATAEEGKGKDFRPPLTSLLEGGKRTKKVTCGS